MGSPIAPETELEAALELGLYGPKAQRRRLAALAAAVDAKHDFDVARMRWGSWEPCPDWGESSWACSGELHCPGDVLRVHVVSSDDHEPVVTSHWQSNGREPAAWKVDEIREAAIEHACTAPRNGHARTTRRLVIGQARGWTSDAIEPVEPDPPQDFRAALATAVNAAAQRDLDGGADRLGQGVDHVRPGRAGPQPAVQRPDLLGGQAERHMQATARSDERSEAGTERAVRIRSQRTEPTPRGPTPAAPSPATDVTPPVIPAGGPGRRAQREAATFPMHHAIDLSLVPEVLRPRVEQLQELRALVEDPPPGVDVAANVAQYVANATADVALATAVFIVQALEPAIEAVLVEGRRLSARKKTLVARLQWLRQVLVDMLLQLGTRRLDGPTVGVSLRTGAWRVEKDAGVDVELLDPRFVRRPPPEPDLAAIGEALERGEAVPGFRRVRGADGVVLR